MNKKIFDKDIKQIMNSMDAEIPAEIDRRVNSALKNSPASPGSVWDIKSIIKWSPVFISIMFLMILGITRMVHKTPETRPFREIRIEYELKEKNIKIIWVKKENFLLGRK